ncbi:hypothetical protein HMSSN036_18210 [Paenibacillus macerans]|nr:hypothetical protein HMSSN036_18210 [Paenibacillus macerans]
MTDAERQVLKEQIEAYNAAVAANRAQLEEMKAQLADKKRQDLASMELRLQELERQVETLRKECLLAETQCKKAEESKQDIVRAEQTWQEAEREHGLVKGLYDVVRGENSKKSRSSVICKLNFWSKSSTMPTSGWPGCPAANFISSAAIGWRNAGNRAASDSTCTTITRASFAMSKRCPAGKNSTPRCASRSAWPT